MDLKNILKNTSIYALGDFFNKAISFLLLPFFTKKLNPEDYGVIDVFLILQIVISILCNFEINQSIARFAPESPIEKQKEIFSSAIFFSARNQVFFCMLLFVCAPVIKNLIYEKLSYEVYFLGVASMFVGLIYTQLLTIARIQINSSLILKSTIANGIVTVIFSCLLVLYCDYKLVGYFIAILSGITTSTLILFMGTKEFLGRSFISIDTRKKLLKFSMPLIPSAAGIFLTLYIDRVVIKQYFDMNELGLFGMAFRFSVIATIIIGSYLSTIGPMIFKNHSSKDFSKFINHLIKQYAFLSLLILAGYSLFAKEIVLIFTSQDVYHKSIQYIYLLATNVVVFNFYVFLPALSISGKTSVISFISISSSVLNLILIFFFIRIGVIGILFSTVISSFFVAIFTYVLGKKYSTFKIDFMNINFSLIIIGFLALINYYDVVYVPNELNFILIGLKICFYIITVLCCFWFLIKRKT